VIINRSLNSPLMC